LRVELESLAAFARGSSQAIRDSLLSLVSGSRKAALEAELSLEIPVGRAAFLEARKAFLSNLQGALEREGEDILRVNSKALMKKPLNPVEANEASS
jgi:flagellar motor switch protein FliG